MPDVPIRNVPVGSRVWIEKNIRSPCKAWYLGTLPGSNSHICGWKPGEDQGSNPRWIVNTTSSTDDLAIIFKKFGCNCGWYVGSGDLVEIINEAILSPQSIHQSAGLPCRICSNFYPMAVANRPDGKSLICWSCRQGWIPPGM